MTLVVCCSKATAVRGARPGALSDLQLINFFCPARRSPRVLIQPTQICPFTSSKIRPADIPHIVALALRMPQRFVHLGLRFCRPPLTLAAKPTCGTDYRGFHAAVPAAACVPSIKGCGRRPPDPASGRCCSQCMGSGRNKQIGYLLQCRTPGLRQASQLLRKVSLLDAKLKRLPPEHGRATGLSRICRCWRDCRPSSALHHSGALDCYDYTRNQIFKKTASQD